jgi:hypothetical protein
MALVELGTVGQSGSGAGAAAESLRTATAAEHADYAGPADAAADTPKASRLPAGSEQRSVKYPTAGKFGTVHEWPIHW